MFLKLRILFLSGCRADASEVAIILLPSNITVFTLDFSGSGLSEGEHVTLGWNEVSSSNYYGCFIVSFCLKSRHELIIPICTATEPDLYGTESYYIPGSFKKKKRVQYKLTGGSVKDGVASSNQGLNIVY